MSYVKVKRYTITPPYSLSQSSVQAYLSLSDCLFVTPAALQCENGLVYDPCGPACSPACPGVQQSPHSQCSALSCVEGCFCPAGMVLHGRSFLQTNSQPLRAMSCIFMFLWEYFSYLIHGFSDSPQHLVCFFIHALLLYRRLNPSSIRTAERSLFSFLQGTVVSFPLSVHVSGRAPFFHLELSSLDTARTGEAA